jgi:hypothetical protein
MREAPISRVSHDSGQSESPHRDDRRKEAVRISHETDSRDASAIPDLILSTCHLVADLSN